MNLSKDIKKWKEPWKKKEFGARMSDKAHKDQRIMNTQSNEMKKAASQHVTIICHHQLLFPGIFRTYTVKLKIPLRKEEIDERMKAAFPELKWESS